MNQSQDLQGASGIRFPSQVSRHQKIDQHNIISDARLEDDSQIPVSSKKSTLDNVKIVHNLIERCMQLYMSKEEVLKFLSEQLRLEPGAISLVWQKLEEENADFFQVYNTRLKVKNQIHCFNELLRKQYNLMEFQKQESVSRLPLTTGSHHMPVNNLPVGYRTVQQPGIPSMVQPPIGYTGSMSDYHVLNGIPEMSSAHPMQLLGIGFPPCSNMPMNAMLPANPTGGINNAGVALPSGQFHFISPGISAQTIDNPSLDSTFAPNIAGSGLLPLEPDGAEMYHHFQPFPPLAWDSNPNPNPNPNPSILEGDELLFSDELLDLVTRKDDFGSIKPTS